MKKAFSNPYFLHLFYCTILLLVSGLLYFITPNIREREQVENNAKCFNRTFEITNAYAQDITNALLMYTTAYKNYRSKELETAALDLNRNTDYLIKMVNEIQKDLATERTNNHSFYTSFLNNKTLTSDKIKVLENAFDSLATDTLFMQIDKSDWLSIKEMITKAKEPILWEQLYSLNVVSANAQLENIKVVASTINVALLNFLFKQVGCNFKVDRFLIAISPSQTTAKVGEPFKIELTLRNYISNFNSDYQIYCDGIALSTLRGVATYEKTFQSPGTHIIKVLGVYKDPFTGQTETSSKDYTIRIIP